MITEDQARMIGKAIRDEANLVATPLANETERRAFSLKMAIDTRGNAFRSDSSAVQDATDVLQAAQMYDDFLTAAKAAESEEAA